MQPQPSVMLEQSQPVITEQTMATPEQIVMPDQLHVVDEPQSNMTMETGEKVFDLRNQFVMNINCER